MKPFRRLVPNMDNRRLLTFFLVTFAAIILMMQIKKSLFPPPAPVPVASQTAPQDTSTAPAIQSPPVSVDAFLTGALQLTSPGWPSPILTVLTHPLVAEQVQKEAQRAQAIAKAKEMDKEWEKIPDDDLVLGNAESKLHVVFSSRGAAVRRLTLNHHRTATRDYAKPDPSKQPLVLLSENEGQSGFENEEQRLAHQSYRLAIENEKLFWRVLPGHNESQIAFEAELPHRNLRIRKQFSLDPQVYHMQLELTFSPIDPARPIAFDYELHGPRGLAIEGMAWKQMSFRQAVTCSVDPNDVRVAQRILDEPKMIDPQRDNKALPHIFNDPKNDRICQYSGIMTQYFSSLVIVDRPENQVPPRHIDRVIPYYVHNDPDASERQLALQGHVGVKLVSRPQKPEIGQSVTHKYLLFAGPSKVLLLSYEPDTKPGLTETYSNLHLNLITDAPFYSWTQSIGWTSVVVFFTNLMHQFLEWLHRVFGSYGVAIIIMTIVVRAMMFPISRKQAIMSQETSAKMAKLKPELKKLEEKYKNDSQARGVAQMELFRKHGVNPLSGCTGCLIVMLQMPIFMGLYYALYESTHLRLEGFLWTSNLAAPDMMIRWAEWPGIGWFVTKFLNFGDFFNLLPIVSVILMYCQQQMMMPPALDEQQAMQMKMMNFMMIFMGYLFYWIPSGLCIYFIFSSAWGMLERKFIPKLVHHHASSDAIKAGDKAAKTTPTAPGWKKKLTDWIVKLQKQADKKK